MEYSIEDKQTHVSLWADSGLSKRAYSKQSGIRYKTFLSWCKRYGTSSEAAEGTSGFIPISVSSPRTGLGEMIELEYPNGILLRFPISLGMDKLMALLR